MKKTLYAFLCSCIIKRFDPEKMNDQKQRKSRDLIDIGRDILKILAIYDKDKVKV